MRPLWIWYWVWTAADVATTIYLHRLYPYGELNAFINALAHYVGFDAACIIAALTTTALLWLLLRLPSFHNASATFLQRLIANLPIAAKTVMVIRFVAPLNNVLIITAGLGFVDLIAIATGLSVYPAYFALILSVTAPVVIYYYRKTPRPRPDFPISSTDVKS